MNEQNAEELICNCGAGHGSIEGHMDWCAWLRAGKTLKQRAAFLIERLDEWSADHLDEEGARDWLEHVEPAIERLRALL
jgi:hypothetical protein